jgi:glucose-1-phosphate cytidylyltransferase
MKVVILAGGLGTRLGEESEVRPKPMVMIGDRPILWHIMKLYAHHGFDDFVVCLGHKGYVVKEYFSNYLLHGSDVTVDLADGRLEFHGPRSERWRVTLVETGQDTMTGGRIRRVAPYLDGERFLMTYGDGLADLDLRALLRRHEQQGRLATVTAVRPPSRFGTLHLDRSDVVQQFSEKPLEAAGWINGGFFVLERAVIDYIAGDSTLFEKEPLEQLAEAGQLVAFRHEGFWLGMDTPRDKKLLETLWSGGAAPWKVWRE